MIIREISSKKYYQEDDYQRSQRGEIMNAGLDPHLPLGSLQGCRRHHHRPRHHCYHRPRHHCYRRQHNVLPNHYQSCCFKIEINQVVRLSPTRPTHLDNSPGNRSSSPSSSPSLSSPCPSSTTNSSSKLTKCSQAGSTPGCSKT